MPPQVQRRLIYYVKEYQTGEKHDKSTSLLDTWADVNAQMEQQVQQRETKRRTNDWLAHLDPHEELLIRLFFGIVPTDLTQIIRLATEEKAKELKGSKGKNREKSPLFEEYSKFFATPCKKE